MKIILGLSALSVFLLFGAEGVAQTNGPLNLTLPQTVSIALERNPTLLVEKIRADVARTKIREELGSFDTLINAHGSSAHRDNIVASRFYPTGFYIDSEQAQGVGVEKRVGTGARFAATLDYKRLISTSNTQTLSPEYSAILSLQVTQPLLRDFGRKANTTRIQVASKTSAIAETNLFQRVSQLIESVEEMYWNVVFLKENLEFKQQSLEVAQGLVHQSEELLGAGIVTRVSVLEARSGLASHEEEVITAENDMKKFEDRLKSLLSMNLLSSDITLADRPLETTVEFNEKDILQHAFLQRSEMRGLLRELEQRQIELEYANNQTRPRLDVTAQYSQNGMSGKPNSTCVDPTSPICQTVGSSISGSIFGGLTSPTDAFSNILSRHPYDNWSVEMKFQLPIGNRTADAQKSAAILQLEDSKMHMRAAQDQIGLEVRDALREIQTARKRIDAASETIRFNEEQLATLRTQFTAGLTSSYLVLQAIDELDKARSTERRAVMDYNVGQSKLRLADASNLERYGIELRKPTR